MSIAGYSQRARQAGPQPAGDAGNHQASAEAAPGSAHTEVRGDPETPESLVDRPPGGIKSWQRQSHAYTRLLKLQEDHGEAISRSEAQTGHAAVRLSIQGDVTPASDANRLQPGPMGHYMTGVGASPIDLLTPSTGAASTVDTPTFSESCEILDLTQT